MKDLVKIVELRSRYDLLLDEIVKIDEAPVVEVGALKTELNTILDGLNFFTTRILLKITNKG